MDNVVIEEIKQVLRDFLVPQIEGIRGDIRALEARIEAVDSKLDVKFELVNTKFDALEMKFDAKFDALEIKVGAKFDSVAIRFDALDMKIESIRRELVAEIRRVEDTLSTDFVRFESNCDLRLSALEKNLN